MKKDELMLKIENVSKIYKLGEIGGTTLRETLQRIWAKVRRKEDPTKKIGAKNYNKGEKFKALDNISFEVKKGERIGIIGHNGAGKSTLLKLISRVTGPTEGTIYLNGRVASMLEVGTGFHGELTGRENVYMNGAILGMTKKEIDEKMEDIIDFSEVRQFIDTPVKRYSSGMYVKLAFSVAAHLDSEIMIMDEVLAVGDVQFQNKCLKKMKSVSEEEERTILYVSHNMNTIRQLCNRVIVLNSGKIIFNGDVEEGINAYLHRVQDDFKSHVGLSDWIRPNLSFGSKFFIRNVNFCKETPIFTSDEVLSVIVEWASFANSSVKWAFSIKFVDGSAVGQCETLESQIVEINEHGFSKLSFSLKNLAPGIYCLYIEPYCLDSDQNNVELDETPPIYFKVNPGQENRYRMWLREYWGSVRFDPISLNGSKIE